MTAKQEAFAQAKELAFKIAADRTTRIGELMKDPNAAGTKQLIASVRDDFESLLDGLRGMSEKQILAFTHLIGAMRDHEIKQAIASVPFQAHYAWKPMESEAHREWRLEGTAWTVKQIDYTGPFLAFNQDQPELTSAGKPRQWSGHAQAMQWAMSELAQDAIASIK